jgi:hypothetical protein
VHQKEKPHDAISKNADLGHDHYRFDCVRDQQLGPCVRQPLGWPSLGHQIVCFGYCGISAWFSAFIPFAPNTNMALKAPHIDA